MAIMVGIGMLLGFHLHILGLAIAFVLFSLQTTVFASFSIALALVTRDINSFAAPINGLNMPVLLLSGVLLPLTLAPSWMRIVAHFNPMYYVVEASRVLASGTIDSSKVLQAFLVMISLMIVVLWWSTQVYRKAVS